MAKGAVLVSGVQSPADYSACGMHQGLGCILDSQFGQC